MGALSLQTTSLLYDMPAETSAQPSPPSAPSVNAQQAQGAPAPRDIVTLAARAPEDQRAAQDPHQFAYDQAAFYFTAGHFFDGANRAPQGQASQQTPIPTIPSQMPVNLNQPQDPGAAANPNPASTDAGNAAPASTGTASMTPQQQLQQLDQSLQQLGISPQTIPLFNRMAMLLYATNPAALRTFVQDLKAAAQQIGQLGDNTAPNQAPPTPQASVSSEVVAAQLTFTEVQATVGPAPGAPADQSSAGPPGGGTATPTNTFSVKLEELQFAFQAVGGEAAQPPANQPTGSTAQGSALNVTA